MYGASVVGGVLTLIVPVLSEASLRNSVLIRRSSSADRADANGDLNFD